MTIVLIIVFQILVLYGKGVLLSSEPIFSPTAPVFDTNLLQAFPQNNQNMLNVRYLNRHCL